MGSPSVYELSCALPCKVLVVLLVVPVQLQQVGGEVLGGGERVLGEEAD